MPKRHEKLANAEAGDERGNWYAPSVIAQEYVTAMQGVQPAVTERLAPGESFATWLAFDLPANTREIAVRMNHSAGPGPLIIGESHLLRDGTEFRFTRQPSHRDALYRR